MKKMFYSLAMIGLFFVSSCGSIQQSEGIGKADSIHVEYCGMGGATRYVIDHSDTLTILHGVFFHDTLGNDCPHLFEPVRKVAPNDIPVIQRLARQLFVECSKPDTLWTKPYKYGSTDWPILSVHVFKKGKEKVYYYETGEEKDGIVYSTSVQIKYSPAFFEFTHRLNKSFQP